MWSKALVFPWQSIEGGERKNDLRGNFVINQVNACVEALCITNTWKRAVLVIDTSIHNLARKLAISI